MKKQDVSEFYEISNKGNHEDLIRNLNNVEETCLNQLETKNVDFGYNKESGHKQLLDAMNDCLNGLEEIKKQSKLDSSKLTEFEKCQNLSEQLEKDAFDLENLKKEFESKFPSFSQKVVIGASSKISKLMTESDFEDETEDGSLRT